MNTKYIIAALAVLVLLSSAAPAEAWCNKKCKARRAAAKTATTTVPQLVAPIATSTTSVVTPKPPTPAAPVATPAPVVVAPTPVVVTPPAPTPAPTSGITLSSGEEKQTAWITAYTRYDNDPPGTANISHPIVHQQANGTGTYADPVTLAVGYTKAGPDIAAGTKFYIPHMQRYFIVEDTCAACHPGYQGNLWIDMWIDGGVTTSAKADACARAVTGVYPIIKNPKSTYPVTAGVISTATCAAVHQVPAIQ